MCKSKLVLGFIVTLSAVAFSAVPAFAEFSSGATSGQAKFGEGTMEAGGLTLTCTSAEGEWKLPTSPSSRGILKINKHNNCVAKSSEIKEVPATFGACEIEGKSTTKGVTKEAQVKASIVRTCTTELKVLFITCKVDVEPEGNKELKKIKATNENSNIALVTELEGVTTKLGGTCPGVKPTKEATSKGNGLLEGVKLV